MTKMKKTKIRRNSALSPVIGEMLMIALVMILIPVVTITLLHQLPQDRTPTVTILMHVESGTVSLHHKGGDHISIDDIEIFVNDKKLDGRGHGWKDTWKNSNHKLVFDLGDEIDLLGYPVSSGTRISLVAKQAVIFRGVVR